MLGRFLEFSLSAPAPAASVAHYEALGFVAATAGDVWPHAYGVMCCEDLALGLHGKAGAALTVSFVQQDVARLHRALEARGIAPGDAVLGHDQFNRLELTDPAGTTVRVIEARSFSAPAQVPQTTLLGRFWRLSLPVADPSRTANFWAQLGFTIAPLGDPWPALASGQELPLAWHARGEWPEPALLFRHPRIAALADRLEARGFDLEERPLPLGGAERLLLRSPENLPAIVLA